MTDIAKLKAAAEKAKDNFIPNFMVSTRDVLELIAQTDALVAAHVNLKLLADTYRQAYEEARARIAELEARERPEPVAYISKADLDAGYPHILARKEYSKACPMAVYSAPPAPVVADERAAFNAWSNEDNLPIAGVGAKNAAWLAWQARATLCGNSVLDVPPERPADSSSGDDVEVWFDEGWNACRAAMLQGAEPVSQPYKLPDGWVAVPKRPTREMRLQIHPIAEASCPDCRKQVTVDCEDNVLMSWDDMLAAAPAPGKEG